MTAHPDPVRDRLDRIVTAYGRNALTDPVALRAAWLATAGTVADEPPAELLAVAAEAGRAGPRHTPDDLVEPAAAASGLPVDRIRPAARVLADALSGRAEGGPATRVAAGRDAAEAALDAPTRPPVHAGTPAPRLVWDEDDDPRPIPAGDPDGDTTTRIRASRPPRRTLLVAGAAALVATVAAVGVAVVPWSGGSGDGSTPGADRYAVADVGERYRALGPDLLAGATRCAALPAAPAEVERVGCDVEGRAMILRTFAAPDTMRAARTDAVPRADVVRSTRRTRDDGEIALSELGSGTSTVAWDALLPRPVSAVVTGRESLVDLTAFLDRRRFTLLPRPQVPGPMFRSGRLWSLADGHVTSDLAPGCVAVQPNETELEAVQCDLPGGGRAQFALSRGRAEFLTVRRDFAGDAGTRPGTRTVTAWSRDEGPTVGLLAQFVNLEGRPALYYDDDALGGYGVLYGAPGGSQAALLEAWSFVAQPR